MFDLYKTKFTAQEVFDTVALHLLSQGEKSIQASSVKDDAPGSLEGVALTTGDGACRYRGVGSVTGAPCKCAVGVLIPDDWYSPRMDAYPTSGFEKPSSIGVIGLNAQWSWFGDRYAEHIPLLNALQSVHDTTRVDKWPRELRRVARTGKLSLAALPPVMRTWEEARDATGRVSPGGGAAV